jgi:PAS domain S-box-containing protein
VTIGQEPWPGHEHYQLRTLEALPLPIYTTDATGRITFYNQAAADFAGRRPKLGSDQWCVSWRLYRPDGTPLPHDKCPMAVTLLEKRPVRGQEAVAERPDGTRVPFRAYPTPLYDSAGELAGGVNLLMDISDQKRLQAEARQASGLREEHAGRHPQGRADRLSGAEAAGGEQTDPLTTLAHLLRRIIASDADPYLLAGALVEGIATALAQKIPPEHQGDVAVETVRLLRDRMRAYGMI